MDLLSDLRLPDVMTFLAVRRCGSLTGAARELRVTPSQVSKSIARLEGRLNARLLSRSAKGVSLTQHGQEIARELDEIVARLRRLPLQKGRDRTLLTFASPSYLMAACLPIVVACLPRYRVRGIHLGPSLIRGYAADGLFDVALSPELDRLPSSWAIDPVGEIRSGLFGPPALAKQLGALPIPVSTLEGRRFIAPVSASQGQLLALEDGCPLGQAEREVGHEVQTVGLALDLATHTGELVFGPVIAARQHVESGRLAEIRVEGWNIRSALQLACNADRVRAQARRTLLETFRTELPRLEGRRPS
jgi:DNA-binding transcriptional LysR family regulator